MCSESAFKHFWPDIWFIILVLLFDFLLYKHVWTEYTGLWCLCGRCRFESGSNMSKLNIPSCGAQVEDAGFNLASCTNPVPFSLPHNIPSKKKKKNLKEVKHTFSFHFCLLVHRIYNTPLHLLRFSQPSFPFLFHPICPLLHLLSLLVSLRLLLSSVPFPILARCRRHRRNLISTISAPSHIEAHTVKNAHTPTQCLISALPPSLFLTLQKRHAL